MHILKICWKFPNAHIFFTFLQPNLTHDTHPHTHQLCNPTATIKHHDNPPQNPTSLQLKALYSNQHDNPPQNPTSPHLKALRFHISKHYTLNNNVSYLEAPCHLYIGNKLPLNHRKYHLH